MDKTTISIALSVISLGIVISLFVLDVPSFLKKEPKTILSLTEGVAAGLNIVASKIDEPAVPIIDPNVYHLPETPLPHGLNLIFFSDGYLSGDEFENDIQILLGQLKKIEPWKTYSDYNIYKILPREIGICDIKTKDERKPVLRCDPDKINAYLGRISTGHFKLIVLSRRNFQSWANVSGIDDSGIFISLTRPITDAADEISQGILFQHLMGHAFGLKDEELFVLAKADSAAEIPSGPNCAPDIETAKKWWGDLVGQRGVGYFNGCVGNKDFIKPTKSSIMNLNDLSSFVSDYGPVSERYLKKILDYCFSGSLNASNIDYEFIETYPEFKTCLN